MPGSISKRYTSTASLRLSRNWRRLAAWAIATLAILAVWSAPTHAGTLKDYLATTKPGELIQGGDRYGEFEGVPPLAPIYSGTRKIGYAYLNTDFSSAVGYSGKPIRILVGIDAAGIIRGIKLVEHKEPIVLIGIPQAKVVAALNSLIGKDLSRVAAGAEQLPQVDIVSGATVTVLVMSDSVVRSAVKLIRSNRLGAASSTATPVAQVVIKKPDLSKSEIRDWASLLGDGSIRSLRLTVGEVSDAFAQAGHPEASAKPETANPGDRFVDLYVAAVSVPTIGRSLLGDAGYERLQKKLKPGQQAIIVAGDGAYSFKGSGYVRGGIFDRIELLQDGQGVRFRDRNHTRLGDLAAKGAPSLREIALFSVPDEFSLDLTQPWELQLLAQRSYGARDKAVLPFNVGYALPDRYLAIEEPPVQEAVKSVSEAAAPTPASAEEPGATFPDQEPLWMKIWRMDTVSVAITVAALLVLTAIFFFQNWLVRRPRLFGWVRRGYLLFTLVWLGWYANAQLSVVNVLTFFNSLISGFSWEFFLSAPLIFILWGAVAAGLLFWGRGPFCGWLCPFGALQELTNNLAQWLKVPQITLPFGLHERLWPIKYIIFLGLFGLSLYSAGMAETYAEVEPFKTAIILKFAREWPFVIFALALLVAGLFIERFYCRYLCPLGAALAIPGRIRMFEWLKRYPDCGSPCQRCAKECPVQAIHPEGQINVNECIYCMHCQELYHDDHRCPHMIQVRLKREKFEALASPSSRGKGPAKPVIAFKGKPIEQSSPVPSSTT
ncbi:MULTISPECIES: NosR/NirI family protein [unclassified Mesorhizobium]|uniref:NosR/NirI family protein n=1 Tax=unclassified Mesorhizobium TaxID=325217 RepID=UPI001093A041|nr:MULTISPECIES: NosR/NirI family protein [unclassified Mesorhizobium]TGQ72950.1 regulatory protein NosR [bacterium M00.F.Ca.ET.205.01.1.1]TGU53706.1 regulatory protein NosR [bacterium M00.F.Ca.ET.152.01.1.1]TGV37205.1 regulatory protein NosR [Mesorhizobium sp. M00.F.Ca.ET.186.01.1.1]TGZ39426.1 regulatory protein NosR [bacterium M00.F.Ca.ET.162.01.1.1]TGT92117.1 regulatory protein NosR [Mesorhizobium sp. M8A.F.Ca.ET.161.01.1.1]